MNNPQKIFDIIPPGKAEESVIERKSEKKEKNPQENGIVEQKKPSFLKKLFLVCILVLVTFVLVAQFVLAKVDIQIWPKTENYDFKDKITINVSKPVVDPQNKTIPGKIIQEEKSATQEFQASGKIVKEQKAQGTIKIYNNYSTVSQILITRTRFMSADGKLFRTVERVIVPGGTYDSKGKLSPGTIDVKVIADQAGEEYNIGATTFSLPGFNGTPKYTAFYGKSFDVMIDGYRGEASQVLKNDLESAKKTLTNKLLEEGKMSLSGKIPEGFVLMDNSSSLSDKIISYEILESTSSVISGAEAKTFSFTVKMLLETIIFKKSDLTDIVTKMVDSRIDKTKKINEKSLIDIIPGLDSLDVNNGLAIITVDLPVKIYTDIDQYQLKQSLQAKPLLEAQSILAGQPQIDKVQIQSWPFWIEKIPKSIDKIEMNLVLD